MRSDRPFPLRSAAVLALALLCAGPLHARKEIDFSPLAVGSAQDSISQVGAWAEEEKAAEAAETNSGDGLATESEREPAKYVKRDFDHREQVVVGSVIMTCIALMMVTMNNDNPK